MSARKAPGAAHHLPQDHAEFCARWQRAAELILNQANVAAVSRQVHLALFYDAQLGIKAMPR